MDVCLFSPRPFQLSHQQQLQQHMRLKEDCVTQLQRIENRKLSNRHDLQKCAEANCLLKVIIRMLMAAYDSGDSRCYLPRKLDSSLEE